MCTSIVPVINAFLELRKRRVKDPVYCRLVLANFKEVAWIWRDVSRSGHLLETQESFVLTIRESTVNILWRPMFDAVITGDDEALEYVLWFLSKNPTVSGGSHLSLDEFQFDEASWDRAASDFYLVRCGKYSCKQGRFWKQPSENAKRWVASDRFQVSRDIRARVCKALNDPLPNGERMTIRRVFSEEDLTVHEQ